MAIAMGITRCVVPAPATRSTSMICSVAYATEESASEEKIGKARIFGRRVCSIRQLGWLRPRSTRLITDPAEELGGLGVGSGSPCLDRVSIAAIVVPPKRGAG